MAVPQALYATLGGEELLQQHYPAVHQMLSQAVALPLRGSRERQTLWQNEGITALNVCICSLEKMSSADGTEEETERLSVLLRSNLTATSEILLYSISILDQETEQLLDSTSGNALNVNYFETTYTSSAPLVRANLHRPLTVSATYTWIENGASCTETVTEDFQAIRDAGVVIGDFSVTAPQPLKGNDTILITYDRVDSGADYSYSNVVHGTMVDVKIPFEGVITAADDYTIEAVLEEHPQDARIKSNLYFSLENDFNVSYCQDNKEALLALYEVSEDQKSVKWKIPEDDWQLSLDKTSFTAQVNAYFYSSIILRARYTPASVPMYTYVSAIVYSTPAEGQKLDVSSDDAEIPPLRLYWGCFGSDTPILMADNRIKMIQDIIEGDCVATKLGTSQVKSTCHGPEDVLIRIETRNGHQVLVTETHPILSQRGLLPANKLNAADLIITVDGPSELAQLHEEPYGGMVYNITLETSDLIIADGIYAGDMAAQNTPLTGTQQCQPQTQLQRELIALFQRMA